MNKYPPSYEGQARTAPPRHRALSLAHLLLSAIALVIPLSVGVLGLMQWRAVPAPDQSTVKLVHPNRPESHSIALVATATYTPVSVSEAEPIEAPSPTAVQDLGLLVQKAEVIVLARIVQQDQPVSHA